MPAVAESSKGFARVSIQYSRELLGNRAALIRLAATLAAVLGLIALAGWTFDLPALRSMLPGAVEVKVNNAICQILCGMALLLLAERVSRSVERLAVVLAGFAVLVALVTLLEYLLHWDAHVDQLLFRDDGHAYNAIRGRMSPYSACAYLALGSALVGLATPRLRRLTPAAAGAGIAIAAVSLLGYLWNAVEIVTDRLLPPEPLPTAVGSLLLGAGVLIARRDTTGADADRIALARVEIKILGGYAIAIALMLFGGGYTYRTSVEFADSVALIAHTQTVRAVLGDLAASLAEAELAQRNYLLTGGAGGLDNYSRAVAALDGELRDLQRLTADNAAQQARIARLGPLLDARRTRLQDGLDAYERRGFDAAARAVAADAARRDGVAIGKILGEMSGEEARLLAERQGTAARVRETTLLSLLATLSLAGGLFALLFQVIRREIIAREAAARALQASEQYNRGIVESSPDCLTLLTPGAQILRMTRHGRRLMEIPDAAAIEGVDWLEWWEGADRAAARGAIDSARCGAPGRFRGFCAGRSGAAKWWDVIVMPIGGTDGRALNLLASAREITDVKRTEEAIGRLNGQLQRKALELETTNRELESFSYSVSHDLRAPLRAIDGFAQMIEEDNAGRLDSEGRRHLAVIRDNSRRMGALIDDLLAFSRMGRHAVTKTEVDMETLVGEVLDEALREQVAIPHIEIGALPKAQADRPLLRQVWVNLVSNALKYGAKSRAPRIDIRGEQGAGEIIYSIRDRGVGFDPQYGDKLFGVFQRLHRADEFSGTGVGLAIVHRIVTRHGGRVWAIGQVGAGAEFFFTLPDGGAHV